MSKPFLIDSSLWTCALRRKGYESERAFVLDLVRRDQAAWCDAIRLELWRGASSDYDRQMLTKFEKELTSYPIDHATWTAACRLADVGRQAGKQFPSQDLVIFSCARQHGVNILSRDKHFDTLAELWPLV